MNNAQKSQQKRKGEKQKMAAKFIESNITSKREIAKITTRHDAIPMKDLQHGTEIPFEGFVVQEITNEETGEVFQSIVIKSVDGNCYATRSETFIRDLKEILDIVAEDDSEEPLIIRVEKLRSKSGNTFVTCSLA